MLDEMLLCFVLVCFLSGWSVRKQNIKVSAFDSDFWEIIILCNQHFGTGGVFLIKSYVLSVYTQK